ncbi:MAG: hypothetical protein V3T43_06250 [Nitrosomonadaceae bacterium]
MTKLEDLLEESIKEELPEFFKMCNQKDKAEVVVLHQAAFSIKEIDLLGAAIKYAGIKGFEVRIIPHADE